MTIIEMRVHTNSLGCQSKGIDSLEELQGVYGSEQEINLEEAILTGDGGKKKDLKAARKTGVRKKSRYIPTEYLKTVLVAASSLVKPYSQSHTCNGESVAYELKPSPSFNFYKHGYRHDPAGGSLMICEDEYIRRLQRCEIYFSVLNLLKSHLRINW